MMDIQHRKEQFSFAIACAIIGLLLPAFGAVVGCCGEICGDQQAGYTVRLHVFDESGEPVSDATIRVSLMTANGPLETVHEPQSLDALDDDMYVGDYYTGFEGRCVHACTMPPPSFPGPPIVTQAVVRIVASGGDTEFTVDIDSDMFRVGLEDYWFFVELGEFTMAKAG